ncbi:hypothetical protein V5799_010431 [Amblyomma americanum]|uniref:Peptidase S1 domain-containing protein n=1 Tax=Amblyomma americanum TaxID=6943 RepID=A0AAQ4EJX1_AMBAM
MRTISLRARRARAWAPLLILSLVFLSVCLHEEAEAARGKKQPCRARHPTRDFELTDGLCMPVHECLQSLSEIGRLKFPIFCGVRLLLPIVCCPLAERRASRTSTTAPEPARPPDESQPAHAPVMFAAQSEEAPAACETPSGQQGRYLPMEGCEALREQVMRKIFPPLCDIRGTTPYACCPTLDGLPQPDTPETTPPPTDAPNASTDYALRMLLLKLENSRHCGKSTGEPPRRGAFRASPTVVRGRSVNLGKYPFMVAIYRDDVSVRNYWCGGTLITYWVVLSAAHCFANSLSDTKYIARVGGVNISDTSGTTFLQRNVTSVHVHPEYDDRRHYNDVALLRLEFPARHRSVKRSFACLPDAAAASSPPPATHGPEATVLGWGHNAFGACS